VRIGDVRLPSRSVDADREYTFTAQAQAGAHAALTGLASIEIEIESGERGQLTVLAPQLEYDPPL
jgi:hypothetical protein